MKVVHRASTLILQHKPLTKRLYPTAKDSQKPKASDRYYGHVPPPVEVDASYKTLMKDVKLSLMKQKASVKSPSESSSHGKQWRELEVVDPELESKVDLQGYEVDEADEYFEMEAAERQARKSPAAEFGSKSNGAVVLPDELQDAIRKVIEESNNKPRLHSDARRLFQHEGGEEDWDSVSSVKYRSRKAAGRHQSRDGAAMASVGLPPVYSVIYRVLSDLRWRLGREYPIERVMEWGGGLGAGVWAAMRAFSREEEKPDEEKDALIANSALSMYWVFDRNSGLVNMGRRLLESAKHWTSISFQNTLKEDDIMSRTEGSDAIALTAFTLSALRDPILRRDQVKQMWGSGAEFIVLIDHGTTQGFQAIAEAREYLLKMGRREVAAKEDDGEVWEDESKRGCHVIAPCPHDRPCPLLSFIHANASKRPQVSCFYSQRLQRPDFVRKTKHSGKGHEDTAYSYVVIRRGVRPDVPEEEYGRERLLVSPPAQSGASTEPRRTVWVEGDSGTFDVEEGSHTATSTDSEPVLAQSSTLPPEPPKADTLDAALRLESSRWPRLIVPPIKRAGHIILDSCTENGSISRITIPRSQGKQAYYDARKSSWGDLFPHRPKNAPNVRYPAVELPAQSKPSMK